MVLEMKTTSKNKIAALEDLADETRALFHRLQLAVEQIHGRESLSGGLRGVLLDLDRKSPQTVPQLAGARSVSRQHIQTLVNRLSGDGLVELVPNPAHKRSSLLRLTREGKRTLGAIERREQEVLVGLRIPVSKKELKSAAGTLRSVREFLESEKWRELL